MFIVEANEVREKLKMEICIDLMRDALKDFAKGDSIQPLRSIHLFKEIHKFGFMPAYLGNGKYFGAKIINACHKNAGTEYPSHAGYVMIFETEHGMPIGLVEAGTITEIRTGAVSGVATDLLAKSDSKILALIGAGAQAYSHLEAMMLVRNTIEEIRIFDISIERLEKFKSFAESNYNVKVFISSSVDNAVLNADIICTLTPSKEPILKSEWVKEGAHINAVGAFTPSTREVSSNLIAKSKLYADSKESMVKECGEFIIPKNEGLIGDDHIVGTIGDVLNGTVKGRENDNEITLFDALGLAIEDVTCGAYFC